MGLFDGTDVVRIGGRPYTRARALAIGYVVIDRDGQIVLTAKGKAQSDSQSLRLTRAAESDAAWRRRQGLPALEPETTEDGVLKPPRKTRVLKPKNVTKTGEEVTDESVLAAIAAESDAKAKTFAASVAGEDPTDG